MSPVRLICGSNTFHRHLEIEICFVKVFEGSDVIMLFNEQLIYFLYVFYGAQKNQPAPEHHLQAQEASQGIAAKGY